MIDKNLQKSFQIRQVEQHRLLAKLGKVNIDLSQFTIIILIQRINKVVGTGTLFQRPLTKTLLEKGKSSFKIVGQTDTHSSLNSLTHPKPYDEMEKEWM